MDQCNFSTLTKIVRAYISVEYKQTQVDFLYDLFHSFTMDDSSSNYVFDPALVSRWMSGKKRVSSKIINYYSKNKDKLTVDFLNNILPKMYDSAMCVQLVYNLFINDDTISGKGKRRYTQGYPCETDLQEAEFLARVLYFTLTR